MYKRGVHEIRCIDLDAITFDFRWCGQHWDIVLNLRDDSTLSESTVGMGFRKKSGNHGNTTFQQTIDSLSERIFEIEWFVDKGKEKQVKDKLIIFKASQKDYESQPLFDKEIMQECIRKLCHQRDS